MILLRGSWEPASAPASAQPSTCATGDTARARAARARRVERAMVDSVLRLLTHNRSLRGLILRIRRPQGLAAPEISLQMAERDGIGRYAARIELNP